MMARLELLVIMLLFAVVAIGMHETCTNQGFYYVNGARFESIKADGRHYSCSCDGRGCIRLTCSRISGPTEAPPPSTDDDDSITGEVPDEEEEDTGSDDIPAIVIRPAPVVPVVFQPPGGACYDEESRREFGRGADFIRISSDGIRRSCTCSSTGSGEISCRLAGCSLPDPPQRTPTYNYIDGCYDPWNDVEYETGTTYNRTRYMDFANQITGTYSCTCSNNMMRCSAVDIPCCDLATGEFVPRGNRFTTLYRNIHKFECTCLGQRGRFGNCLRPDGRNPFGPGGRLLQARPQPTRYHPIGRDRATVCRDQRRRTYDINSVWYEYRNGGTRWRCVCQQRFSIRGTVVRKECRRYN